MLGELNAAGMNGAAAGNGKPAAAAGAEGDGSREQQQQKVSQSPAGVAPPPALPARLERSILQRVSAFLHMKDKKGSRYVFCLRTHLDL